MFRVKIRQAPKAGSLLLPVGLFGELAPVSPSKPPNPKPQKPKQQHRSFGMCTLILRVLKIDRGTRIPLNDCRIKGNIPTEAAKSSSNPKAPGPWGIFAGSVPSSEPWPTNLLGMPRQACSKLQKVETSLSQKVH